MPASIAIQPLDYANIAFSEWQAMWIDYLGTHASTVAPAVHRHTFDRICAANSSLHGLVAHADRSLGFVHYYFHPSSFNLNDACTIEDLYVSPEARGKGVGRWLINAVAQQARLAAAPALHWRTGATNVAAIKLYESLATRGDSLPFRMQL